MHAAPAPSAPAVASRLLAATAKLPTAFMPYRDPACPTCGTADPGLLDGGTFIEDPPYTSCCGDNPVAFTCRTYGVHVYVAPDGSEPEQCPHCDTMCP
ncbi:hypothetical protein AB0F17_34155 [Nonomuraea sp. NPDC026600]|uniref:hypothetical protein n=1 Tax=Nonomuraea sp. NPDC026600 TaxID=3155363 RepID=UPI0033F95A39